MCVRVTVCRSYISKTIVQTSHNLLSVHATWFGPFSGDNEMRYVLPVFWMTP